MSFSRWSNNTEESIQSLIEGIMNYTDWHIPAKDPLTNEDLLYQVSKSFEENKTIELNGTNIEYNLIKYEYEKVKAGEETNAMRSSRIFLLQGYAVVYSDGTNTQYITNRSNNDTTKTILRKLSNYIGQGEVKSNEFRITEDLFIWMISKVLDSSTESLDEDSILFITKIVGFKGSSHDQLAEVTGSGNRIMNALSTLAFLFENEGVSYVKPIVEYKEHTIELFLKINGSIDINFETYLGDYFMDDEDELISKLTLLVSLEIIPKIISAYGEDVENDLWSTEKKANMIAGIGENIQDKVTEKVSSLRSTI